MKKYLLLTLFAALISSFNLSATIIETSYDATSGNDGIMFDVVTGSNAITLTDIGVFLRAGSISDFEFYTIDGGIGVNATNSAAWTLRDSFSAVAAIGVNGSTLFDISNFMLAANTTYGLYFTLSNAIVSPGLSVVRYTDSGASLGDISDSNADLSILTGIGAKYPFGDNLIDRDFNGSLTYVVSKVPEPSTLAIFALAFMGLASRNFKKQY